MNMPTAYIGPVGSLVPFLGPSEQTNTDDRPVSFVDTMGGRKAFLGRPGRREWGCSLDARYPGELSGLMWLASYGNPPFVWYPADAIFGNALPPAQAALAPGTHSGLQGPLVEVSPGVHVASAFPDGGSAVSLLLRDGQTDPLPIVAGRPVTVSAWLRGSTSSSGQVIAVVWRDVVGANVGVVSEPVGDATDVLTRRSLTVTPPPGAVQITLQFFAEQVAGPAVTMTDRLMPYSPGKGAKRVVVHGLSESLILVTERKSLSGLSFTVSEVG